jgi:hypothetical protein
LASAGLLTAGLFILAMKGTGALGGWVLVCIALGLGLAALLGAGLEGRLTPKKLLLLALVASPLYAAGNALGHFLKGERPSLAHGAELALLFAYVLVSPALGAFLLQRHRSSRTSG